MKKFLLAFAIFVSCNVTTLFAQSSNKFYNVTISTNGVFSPYSFTNGQNLTVSFNGSNVIFGVVNVLTNNANATLNTLTVPNEFSSTNNTFIGSWNFDTLNANLAIFHVTTNLWNISTSNLTVQAISVTNLYSATNYASSFVGSLNGNADTSTFSQSGNFATNSTWTINSSNVVSGVTITNANLVGGTINANSCNVTNGVYSTPYGTLSFAPTALGGSLSIGTNSIASGIASLSIGNSSTASGSASSSFGDHSSASASSSLAIGRSTVASGATASAIGYNANATASGAIQIGDGVNSNANTTAIFTYEILDGAGNIPTDRFSSNGDVRYLLSSSNTSAYIVTNTAPLSDTYGIPTINAIMTNGNFRAFYSYSVQLDNNTSGTAQTRLMIVQNSTTNLASKQTLSAAAVGPQVVVVSGSAFLPPSCIYYITNSGNSANVPVGQSFQLTPF